MKKKKKTDLRSQQKYPCLEKRFNLKLRDEFIDNDYIDGVFDDKGNMVIRPLNDKEKEWLNQFNREYINANFNGTSEIKKTAKELMVCKKKKQTEYVKNKIKKLKIKLRRLRKNTNFYKTHEEEKEIYNENNARNRCLFNRARASSKLISLDTDQEEISKYNLYSENDNDDTDDIN